MFVSELDCEITSQQSNSQRQTVVKAFSCCTCCAHSIAFGLSIIHRCHGDRCWNAFASCYNASFHSFQASTARIIDVIGYNNLIGACAQDAQWRRAMHLQLQVMPNLELRADAISSFDQHQYRDRMGVGPGSKVHLEVICKLIWALKPS